MSPSSDCPVATRRSLRLLSSLVVLPLLLLLSHNQTVAQSVGAGRGDVAGSGGSRSIQGRLITPSGKMPDVRVRITLDSPDSGSRSTFADEDGNFNFNNLQGGNYQIRVDAGKDYEIQTESVYMEGAASLYKIPIYLRMKPGINNEEFMGVPKAAIDLYEKAIAAARKNDSNKAVEYLEAALAMHPQFDLALNELGMQYLS